MTDDRRVCDLTASELLDAAWRAVRDLGWTRGPWVLEVHVNDGVTRRIVPSPMPAQLPRSTLGRYDLDRLGAASQDNKPTTPKPPDV